MVIVHPAHDHVVRPLLVVTAKYKEGTVVLLREELELGGVLERSDVILLVVGDGIWFLSKTKVNCRSSSASCVHYEPS